MLVMCMMQNLLIAVWQHSGSSRWYSHVRMEYVTLLSGFYRSTLC